MADLVVREETMVGRTIDEWVLPGLPERITAREVVRLRVREEVARFRSRQPQDQRVRLSWEEQAEIACAGFARNTFVMIAGDRQVEDLDEVIDVERAHSVAFIRLTPLVGG